MIEGPPPAPVSMETLPKSTFATKPAMLVESDHTRAEGTNALKTLS
jgi:hypothetical protein